MLYAVIAISLNFSIWSSNVGEEVKVKLRPVFYYFAYKKIIK